MDTAISLEIAGKQKEVVAEELTKRKKYKRGTFICPECGEDVFLRFSDKQKSYFAHYMRSEIYKDCDLRVDGNSNLTIYERLGVPLYLTKSKINGYELNIGLKAISNESLMIAESQKAYLEVIYGKSSKRINIDRFNFPIGELSLFKIDQYPAFKKPFLIQYKNVPSSINKWADFIDPVLEAGILFSVNSNVGKSIRHGDTIYSDEEYLWLSPRKLHKNNILEKNIEFEGEILLNNKSHYIYKVVFIKNEKNYSNFVQLSNALHEKLKVVLLESKNKINFLWPPSIKTEEGYLISSKGRVHNVIHSVNSNPNIYMYRDDGYKQPQKLNTTYHKGINYLNYNLSESETQLNMDRKITSTGINIMVKHHGYTGEDIQIIDNKTMIELNQEYHSDDLNLELVTNVKLNSLIVDSNKRIDTRKYNINSVNWRKLRFGDVIYLLNNDNLTTKIHIDRSESFISFSISEIKFLSQMPQKKVVLTAQNREKIHKIINADYNFSQVFKKILKSNTIPYTIHQLLKEV